MKKNQAMIYLLALSGMGLLIMGIVFNILSISGIGVIILAGLVMDHFLKENDI